MGSIPSRAKGKGLLMAILAFVLVGTFSVAMVAQKSADDVVARINDEVITEQELYDELVRRGGREVLDQMITQRLIHQAALDAGITADEEAVEAELDRVRGQLPPGMDFEDALGGAGITRDELVEEIRLNLVLRELLTARVEIAEEEMQAFFEQYKDFLGTEEQVKVRHILVEAEDEAHALRDELVNGADFAELAREHSIDPGSAQRGGDLGWVSRNQMVRPFEDMAFTSPVGEISPVVETDFGYHVLLVEERQEAEEAVYEERKEEIRGYLLEEKLQETFETWLEEARGTADIEINI